MFIYTAIGIAIGAMFSPFWIKVWEFARDQVQSLINRSKK